MLKQNHSKTRSKLAVSSIIKNLPDSIFETSIQKSYKADMVLPDQNEGSKYIAMILSGQAIATSFDIQGKESWINTYDEGQFIGVESLYNDYKSNCYIVAKTDISVLYFRNYDFLKLIRENTALADYVMKDLVAQLQHYSTATVKIQSLSKRGLIASEFKRLAHPLLDEPETYVISPAPVVTELALKLGVARETVSRTVSDLVKKNVLKRQTGIFIVPDLNRLEAQVV